jgi:hypothetical protein
MFGELGVGARSTASASIRRRTLLAHQLRLLSSGDDASCVPSFGRRSVTDPAGVEWRVGRVWVLRGRLRWRAVDAPQEIERVVVRIARWAGGPGLPVEVDPEAAVLALGVIAVFVALVLLVVPLILFGVDIALLVVGAAAVSVGSTVLGRPWTVDAESGEDRRAWRVRGWAGSSRVIAEVADALARGVEPVPEAAVVVGGHEPKLPPASL